MQLAEVLGHATSTVKHPTLSGWRLLVVQPLNAQGGEDGEPLVALDNLGCGRHSRAVISSDGKAARAMVGADNSPARWIVIGIVDE